MKTQVVLRADVAIDWHAEFSAWLHQDRSSKTVLAYEQDLNIWCSWFEMANGTPFGLDQMNSADLRAFRQWSLDVQKVKPATWNRRRATLKILCEWAEGKWVEMPFDYERMIKPAEEQEQAPRWLTGAEKRQVMRQLEINLASANTAQRKLRALRDLAIIQMMLYAGLRVEEVANLLASDICISDRKGSVVVRKGKREKRREVPLSASLRLALSDYLEAAPRAKEEPLFTDENGCMLSTRAIQKRVEALASQLGISGLSCHALRHTCAKSILDSGRPVTEVQKVLGHKKLETTARYVQPGQEDLQAAVEAGELGRMANRDLCSAVNKK
jgi:site-specific recombinase XerD